MTIDYEEMWPTDLAELWEKNGALRGPTIRTIGPNLDKMPLCAACPLARWHERKGELFIFCKEYRELMPTTAQDGVGMCDAYVLAISLPPASENDPLPRS